jgi:hypothetical protein
LNGTHQLLLYANDVNKVDKNINIKKEGTEVLLDVGARGGGLGLVGVEVHKEKTKYMFMSRHQNTGEYHNGITEKSQMWQSSNIWERQ